MIGKTIGNYEITGEVGAGGMGEVFRARDTKLGRDVAIKVLPDVFARDPDRLARFEREAKILAGLNHANIASIYGIEEADGAQYLVLEMVEGEDLSERISRGPVPIDETLEIAQQMAEALEAAHENGIIHRDLKPANIKLTPEGRVKVLDFGLAKALDTSASDSGTDISHSPTVLGSSPTAAGVILGTAAYMSPEQARGKTVDKRVDIFAFGVVVFEMLHGGQVFVGETVSDTLAAVLRAEPDYTILPDNTPRALTRLIRRCLEKDVRRRLRDIGEARITIENIRSGVADTEEAGAVAEPAAKPSFLRANAGWVAAAVILIGSLFAMMRMTATNRPTEMPIRKSSIQLSHDDPSRRVGFGPAISPDGRYVAYVSHNELWLRDLTALEPQRLAGTQGALQPFWSPDGEWIGFGLAQTIHKIPRGGGQPTLVTRLPPGVSLGLASSAVWTPDGEILIGPGTTGLHRVSSQGGTAHMFLPPADEGETDFHEICALPDGRGWVFVVHNDKGMGTLDVVTRDGNRRKNVIDFGDVIRKPAFSPSGHILVERDGGSPGIWALPFSVDRLEATGEPFIVAAGGKGPSVSADGTLVYTANVGTMDAQLVWLTRDGEIAGTIGEPAATGRPFPTLSPDGKLLLMAGDFGDGRELFLYDLATGSRRRLTFNTLREDRGVWHPNRHDIVYFESGTYTINLFSLDGSSENRVLVEDGLMPSVTPDGSQIVFSRQEKGAWNFDIYVQPYDGAQEPTLLISTSGVDWAPEVSPDGRYLLYQTDETGRDEIYATTFPNPTTRWQVSVDGGEWAVWRNDGREIFFTTRNAIYAVECSTTGGLTLGPPRKLFDRPTINWASRWADGFAVTADGQRFVMAQPTLEENASPPLIVVVQNWYAEFDRRGGR